MFRYLKAAFLIRPCLPGIGPVPVNVLFAIAMAILGFGHPAFWLIGIGVETALLVGLSTNPRFQKLTDAMDDYSGQSDAEAKRQSLIQQLLPAARARMIGLQARCNKAEDMARGQGVDDYAIEGNRAALNKLAWLYLKLLTARQYLQSQESQSNETELRRQIASLQHDLGDTHISDTLREAKSGTLQILQRRIELLQKRAQSLEEIESNITRIEAQVDLAVENAGMSAQPQAVSSNISLVSQMLDPDLFGESQATIADLDQTFASTTAGKASA
jgi:hypothetical protein